MHKRIAIVGDKGSVIGFKAVGFDVFEAIAENAEETENIIHDLVKKDYGVIFITEQCYQPITKFIDTFKDYMTPAIIPIPSKDGTLGIGLRNVKKNVERAVGADILFND